MALLVMDGPVLYKEKTTRRWSFLVSGRRESNPRDQLGRLKFYH